jgi:SAM-dependent methyltransferase
VNPYDEIRYPGQPYAHTHPDRLASMAAMRGLAPAHPERCRVLEVGCGDGRNVVPLAYALPGSTFEGIDIAGGAIAAARDFAARSGVGNATFDVQDLAAFPRDAGTFDYIVAHGVYSWIPTPLRDALLALIAHHLAPQGVAFVSYNTLPGCRLRQMVWDMLKFHTALLADPQSQLTEAKALVRLIAHGSLEPDEYTQPLVAEARRVEDRPDALLFHDDLASVNEPVYFHEFVDHAARHGLRFMDELAFAASTYVDVAAEARAVLATLDPLTRQQYLDFIACRRFRETLLCRAEVDVAPDALPSALDAFSFGVAPRIRATPQDPGMNANADPGTALIGAMLAALRAAAPRTLPLGALWERLRAAPDSRVLLEAVADPRSVVLAAVQAGAIQPHVVASRAAYPAGARPVISAVVRAQLGEGDLVTSLSHHAVRLEGGVGARLLALMDGSRDRLALHAALATGSASGPAPAALDAHIDQLARLELLIA